MVDVSLREVVLLKKKKKLFLAKDEKHVHLVTVKLLVDDFCWSN